MNHPRLLTALSFCAASLAAGLAPCSAQAPLITGPVEKPATQPAPTGAAGGTPTSTIETSPEAVELLTRVQEKTEAVNQLSCKIVYTRTQELLGDKQERLGSLVFLRKPGPARFGLRFTRLIVDDREEKEERNYIYDGQWIVESIPAKKQFFKRQVVDPTQPAQEDLLESGKGPFIIPLTTRKDQILARFNAVVVKPGKRDPDNTVHIRLEPRAGQRSDFTGIDIWYDTTTLLPRKVRAVDGSQNVTDILLQEIVTNLAIDASLLDTTPPAEAGWLIEVTPWEKAKTGGERK